MVDNLLKKFNIKHVYSTSYYLETNGLTEQFNKTLCESLAKVAETNTDWDKNIPSVLFAYRTKKNKSSKLKPFYVMHGREAKIPLDKDENKITMMERIRILIEELPSIRMKAKENIEESQEKQKEYHDKKNKINKEFEIGDKVLLYEAWREKQWSGKLQEKWKGPYVIHEKLFNGSYKLREMNGKVLKTPRNGKWLKKYQDRTRFEPRILIKGKMVVNKREFKFD